MSKAKRRYQKAMRRANVERYLCQRDIQWCAEYQRFWQCQHKEGVF